MRKSTRLAIIGIAVLAIVAAAGGVVYALVNDHTAPKTVSDARASYTGPANVTFTAWDDDGGAGVAYMYYRVDRHAPVLYRVGTGARTSVTIPAPEAGSQTHRVRFWSQDKAGNVEAINSMLITVNAGSATPAPAMCHFACIEGTNRYATAVAASKAGFASADTVVVARGDLFADALGGSALAGAVHGPLLLTPPTAVPDDVLAEIQRLGATKVYVLGGAGSISQEAFGQLEGVAGTVQRLAGDDRYATATLVASETVSLLGASYEGEVFVTTGQNYPDALAASPIAYAKGIPVVLVRTDGSFTLPAAATKAYILGSSKSVPTGVVTQLGTKFVDRLQGVDRYGTAAAVASFGVSQGMAWDGVGVATGENPADALSGGALLGAKGAVMLLTPTKSLAPEASAELSAHKAEVTLVRYLGSTSAVSAEVRTAVEQLLK